MKLKVTGYENWVEDELDALFANYPTWRPIAESTRRITGKPYTIGTIDDQEGERAIQDLHDKELELGNLLEVRQYLDPNEGGGGYRRRY
ncbi:MAG: hypothetical protein AAF604_06405 [Acidobacteriota bacterium]